MEPDNCGIFHRDANSQQKRLPQTISEVAFAVLFGGERTDFKPELLNAAHGADEALKLHWLGDVAISVVDVGCFDVFAIGRRAQDYNRDRTIVMTIFESREDLVTIHAR